MIDTTIRKANLSLIAVAAVLALSACHRGGNTPTGSTAADTPSSTSTTTASADTAGTASSPTNPSAASPSTAPDMGNAANTSGTGSTAPLQPADQQFVTEAAAGGMFEVEIGKLAAEKATDPGVKNFAQMLVDDHSAANDKLRQIATGHNVALPASLPDDKKKEIDQLAKLSGANFDKQFIKMVGVKDHHHDIAAFEKASSSAQSPDVKDFATSALPTLKKHLAAAEKLPAKG
ncbi:DUF4142 domain-containing protein [Piscinibacter terrae]|uniref:DUF4142 domain-containing protein n=1 Tax=Piscinibacter terrae TaxID=2496871 RepID=A0A3N7HNX8_9BURK|nr:DUF4142 domain-containing protein [Albitalea terrae]RQP22816.1 DUF4142 domain-containing protein [Albitalea terrae]